jgi:transketolase N-terminal domain/subunit
MTLTTAPTSSGTEHDRALRAVEDRVLWLATAIVDHANRVRPNPAGLKVGGHQASSASIVTIMTALWLEQLTAEDRISVKPHASPVLHALEYLLGQLDAKYLTTLREFGGLQSYPSRLKDPVPADYSTGSVGIGATAPIWGAIARRYVGTQFGTRDTGRQWSLVGDAELDEGAVWEAVLDPMVAELGEVVWVVDLNRQSLDRVLPTMGGTRLQGMFTAGRPERPRYDSRPHRRRTMSRCQRKIVPGVTISRIAARRSAGTVPKQRQPRPVRPRQTRMSARPLALSHSELMAQHKDLGVLPPPLPPRQAQQRDGTGDNQEDQLQAHKPKIIPRPGRPRPAWHVPDVWPGG